MEEGRGGAVDFGGYTPEAKAAHMLKKMFTFVAARTVMAELEGYDNEGGSAHSNPIWVGLQEALTQGEGASSDEFVTKLMQHPSHDMRMTAVRIVEVRADYMREVFNWDKMRGMLEKEVAEDTARAQEQFFESQFRKLH